MSNLPCRLSYYPNQIHPRGFYTYIPHPDGKKSAVRVLFKFSTFGGESEAMRNAIEFSNSVGEAIWGDQWKDSGRMPYESAKGKAKPKADRNNTGVNGVSHRVRYYPCACLGGFTRSCLYRVSWYENGKQFCKQFGYGGRTGRTQEQAFKQAVEFRREMEKEFYIE